ncbi:hypothetical protein C5E02_01280 [Rathayibacter rathayi]|nr:hypothetical protein C1O28_01370 [Rathayibacter rathayi]PPF50551.1 hypothetical protein C5C08_04840 [Rathayibacter rathayi]PPG13664.1 hypothetical protein C5C11_06735 [Rathayibacter rathayi]PPG45296.1 hypothetical protein C5C20_04495 [Rathayibacter rathayi]PPG69155.1 hypothetical protein C5C16_06635 [Rathayibacter rathayi]
MTDATPLEQAQADLDALEQRIRDGEGSPLELGAAQARVEVARLRDEGTRARQRADLARIRANQVRNAKLAALGQLHNRQNLPKAYDRAVEAFEDLVRAVEKHNAWIDDTAKALEAGGVPALGWDRKRPEGFDPATHATIEEGGIVSSVTIAGESSRREIPGLWARAAFKAVAIRRKLTDGHGALLERVLGKDIPDALRDR